MLSRIADSLYWMSRYMERADGLLRSANTQYILGMDKDINGPATWKPVLEVFTNVTPGEIKQLENNAEASLQKLLIDAANENSFRTIVNHARENARGAQDHITKEVWEEINQMFHLINHASVLERLTSFRGVDVLKELTSHTVLYAGIIDITMPRGSGWFFMSMGRYVERCMQTVVLIEKELELLHLSEADTNDVFQWKHLLFSLSGYELYLKTYHSPNHSHNVLHHVLANENFSRSLVYSLRRIGHYLLRISPTKDNDTPLLRILGRLYSKVRYMEPEVLNHLTIEAFLKEIKMDLAQFNYQLQQQFFSYA